MKLGVITTSYPRHPDDAAGSFVAGLSRWLAAEGHTVEVIAAGPGMDRDGPITVRRVGAGARLFYDEGAPERLARSGRAWVDGALFSAALAAVTLASRRHWDAMISHWLVPCGVAAALASVLPRRPHLAIAHSGDVHLAVSRGWADALVALLDATSARIAFAGEHLRRKLANGLRSKRLARALLDRILHLPDGGRCCTEACRAHRDPASPGPRRRPHGGVSWAPGAHQGRRGADRRCGARPARAAARGRRRSAARRAGGTCAPGRCPRSIFGCLPRR